MKIFQFILTALLGSTVSLSVFAVNEKGNTQSSMPQQCERLFSETENLIADAEKQPGTHTQVSKIKNKLSQSKKQILAMDLAVQIKSCDQGLAKLTNLKHQEQDYNN
ncbi:hypothetical protein EDC44_1168 [Cricetibacter osteomyelitidis]|uniref:Recombinase XerD n=1 Tax=Cricetibacter osteomyelitidis TaxID=1521931 RepID=A0A4R2T0Q5_9PAST|nr:DUF5339 domain-containing protein [Cricetibacter osteomyelitidis]TCP94646.1 hypothetical protein EDC44_1168 [Cricetibacter osteomyelitidis]